MEKLYDKVEIRFIEEDEPNNEKIALKIYLRRKEDREFFEANVKLDKKCIKKIEGDLSKWQKARSLNVI